MGIDTNDVLDAAGTKWNFLKYKPGLVGGHCIGVDPYYLAHKADTLGYYPQVILSGRRVNDYMSLFIANRVIQLMIRNRILVNGASVLILGITFKENCSDIRNSKVIDIYDEFLKFGVKVTLFDPVADEMEVRKVYDVECKKELPQDKYDAIVLTVAHNYFLQMDISKLKRNDKSVIFDSKACLQRDLVDARL
jgi:UDP-N-acetyl-D-galactosamine dehydrogenase